MATVGAYEAKTKLPELLKRVEQGEQITITKHGTPIAVLVPAGEYPAETPPRRSPRSRSSPRADVWMVSSIQELVDEGRRR